MSHAQSDLPDLAELARDVRTVGPLSTANHSVVHALRCRQESTAAAQYVKMEQNRTHCSSRAFHALEALLAQPVLAASVGLGNVQI